MGTTGRYAPGSINIADRLGTGVYRSGNYIVPKVTELSPTVRVKRYVKATLCVRIDYGRTNAGAGNAAGMGAVLLQ